MRIQKIKIASIITWLTFLISNPLTAQEPANIQHVFTQTDSSYSFYGLFKVKASIQCLLDISYEHKHVEALAPDAKEVRLIEQGDDWNEIGYTYQKFIFFKNSTVWHRIRNEEDQRIDFTLLSSENNHKIMPKMLASSGYYQITSEGEYSVMEYYQQCQLTNESITKLYLKKVQKSALNFLHGFYEYATKFCSHSPST